MYSSVQHMPTCIGNMVAITAVIILWRVLMVNIVVAHENHQVARYLYRT